MFDVLDTRSEQQGEEQKPGLEPLRERIVFEAVSLRYEAEGPLVLQQINLEVKAGEVVALVGMSGAGKSSLVQLLPRFYNPVEGRITIDGVSIHDVSLPSLRRRIGYVS